MNPDRLTEEGVHVHVNRVPATFEVSGDIGCKVIALLFVERKCCQVGSGLYGHHEIRSISFAANGMGYDMVSNRLGEYCLNSSMSGSGSPWDWWYCRCSLVTLGEPPMASHVNRVPLTFAVSVIFGGSVVADRLVKRAVCESRFKDDRDHIIRDRLRHNYLHGGLDDK